MPKRESGSGILILIVLAVIGILSLLLLYQSRLTSWTSAETGILMKADRAELLADSAVNECMARVRSLLKDRNSALFSRIRRPVFAPDPGDFKVPEAVQILPHTNTLLDSASYKGYELDLPEVRVQFQRQLDQTSYERYGVFRFRCAAHYSRGIMRRVTRRIEVTQGFKIVLNSVPRPFCSFGVFLARADGLTDFESLEYSRGLLQAAAVRLAGQATQARAGAPPDLRRAYDELKASLLSEEAAKRASAIPFETGSAFYGLTRDGRSLDLATLDLATDLSLARHETDRLLAQSDRCFGQLGNNPSDPSLNRAFIEAALKTGRKVQTALWCVWAFKQVFRVVPPSGPDYANLAARFSKLEPDYWKRRVQYNVSPREGENLQQAWDRFVNERSGGVAGVIAVGVGLSPPESLHLCGRLRGRVVLVTGAGGCTIENFNKEETFDDWITVVSLDGPLSLRGENHCSIVLARPENGQSQSLVFAPDSKLFGNITAYSLPPTCTLRGLLVRSEKYCSGYSTDKQDFVGPEYLHTALARAPRYRRVVRR